MKPGIFGVGADGRAARRVPGGDSGGSPGAGVPTRAGSSGTGSGGSALIRGGVLAALLLVASAPGQAQVSAPGVDTVAVVAFANITGAAEDDWIGFGIAETITADLAGSGAVAVVGNDAVQAALRQARAGSGGAVDLSDTPAVQAGRALGARWVVSGGFQRLGRQVRLTARIVDVATAAVRHATTVDGTLDELFDLQDRLSADLRGGLSASAARDGREPAVPGRCDAPADAPAGCGARPAGRRCAGGGGAGAALRPAGRRRGGGDGPPLPVRSAGR